MLAERGLSTAVGDEGGFAPDLARNEDAITVLLEAIERAGSTPGDEVAIALDPATTELWRDGAYELAGEGRTLASDELADYWAELVDRYPIVSIEDGMAEEDWDGWRALTERLGDRVQLVGDDLFVTNPERIERGIERGRGQRGPDQAEPDRHADRDPRRRRAWPAGTRYGSVISHRSGETEDTTVADLAVALGTGQIKAGAPARSDRVAKYNQLLRIEEDLGESARYLGGAALAGGRRSPGHHGEG